MDGVNLVPNVVIQGYEGCFHQIAAERYFGNDMKAIPCRTFKELSQRLAGDNGIQNGVMAIENSIAGSILPNYNFIRKYDLSVIGEVYLRIKQNLMVLPGTKIDQLKEVHSHPMAIHQCEAFFDQFPTIKLVETEDTALSAKYVATKKDKSIGAIAGDLAAKLFGLDIIGEEIETNKNNYTRFLILSNTANLPHERLNKASLCFQLNHEPNALANILQLLGSFNVNLSKIQSFPVLGKKWEYSFHLDLELNPNSRPFKEIFAELHQKTTALQVLGQYEKGDTQVY